MRYCEKCGYVMDELDSQRDKQNCPICSGIWSEDDMTSLKYAELSETEKDTYDKQLLEIIENSPKFCKFDFNSSPQNGNFWKGFRIEKYLRFEHEERIVKNVINRRKANEPFKPFPPIDTVKAREVAKDAEIAHKAIERGYYNNKPAENNVPKCPTCSSTNLTRISTTAKVVNVALFGLLGQKRKHQFKCNNCGYEW